jgi:peptidyl-prolyl cis-trans isomerase D
MLKTMRNNLKSLSWTLWLVIIAFIGFIFVQWGSGRFESGGLGRDVASVGRYTISGEDFQKSLTQSLEMYGKQFKDNLSRQMINQLGIAEQVLQGMISGCIVQGEAARLHLRISDAELEEAIRSYPAFQSDGKFIGPEEYERLLAYNHIMVRDFEDGLRKDMLGDKLKELVTAAQVLDLDTLHEEFRKENDKAELQYIAFRSADLKTEPEVSEEELRAYYQKNPGSFLSAEKRAGEVLALKFADFKKEISLTDDELFTYFKQNKGQFKIAGKTRVSRIWTPYEAATREQVLKNMEETAAALTPANFADKARELSGDDKAKEGGDWGYWAWQDFSAQEKAIIDSLKAGEISSPVDTGKGFSLIYVSEKVPEQQEDFAAVKARIQDVLQNEKLKRLAGQKIAQVYDKIKKAGNLKEGAGKLAAKVTDSGLLAQGQPIQGIDEMGYISQRLFSLGENEVSQPFELPDGIAVVRLTRIVPPQTEKFEDIRGKVKSEVQNAKKLEILAARAGSVAVELNRITDAKKADDYLKKEGLKAETATFQRGNRLADFPETAGLDDRVFAMGENAGYAPVSLQNAVILVRVKSKKVTSEADFAREKEGFYSRKLEEAKNSSYGSFLLSRKDAYKIRFNAEIFEKIKEYVISRYR